VYTFTIRYIQLTSAAGTNSEVGAPVRSEIGGIYRSGEKRRKNFWSCPFTFLALEDNLSFW